MYHNPVLEELRKQGRLDEEQKNITVGVCHGDPVLIYKDPDSELFGHLHCVTAKGIDPVRDQLDVDLFQRVYNLVS